MLLFYKNMEEIMKATASEAMTSWSEFLVWCTQQGKEPRYYTSMQEYLKHKGQVQQSC
jgi:hypothetical protein